MFCLIWLSDDSRKCTTTLFDTEKKALEYLRDCFKVEVECDKDEPHVAEDLRDLDNWGLDQFRDFWEGENNITCVHLVELIPTPGYELVIRKK